MENEDCLGVAAKRSRTKPTTYLYNRRFEPRLGRPEERIEGFHLCYILLSEKDPTHRYTGLTDDLEARHIVRRFLVLVSI